MATIAKLSGVRVNGYGQGYEVTGSTIWSARASIAVAGECFGMESAALLFALVLCFPAPWFARAWGVVAGACGDVFIPCCAKPSSSSSGSRSGACVRCTSARTDA